MKTNILLNQREKDTLNRTIEILEEYSRIWSASVKNKRGFFCDNAASAAGMIKSILEDQKTEAETPAETA